MQFKEIPRKLIVSKRLAQCLNPALPTGVHQRALDVYTHILTVLGVCVCQLRNSFESSLIFIPQDGGFEKRSLAVVFWAISVLRIRRHFSEGRKF